MPYGVKRQGDRFAIYKKDTGEIVGHSDSEQKAWASVRAREYGARLKGEK